MSFFDGLGPSIFCRLMEQTRLMREEIVEKVFIFRQSEFLLWDLIMKVFFFVLHLDVVYKQICFPSKKYKPKKVAKIRRNDSTKKQKNSTDSIEQ